MRFVFLDEGGISAHEPMVVVSGVIVDGDTQVEPLEARLSELIEKHIPKPDRAGFVFHAKDIWAGGKYFKNRDVWPWERRASILDDLAAIPKALEIPIVFGRLSKDVMLREHPGAATMSARDRSVNAHAIAFLSCTLNVEEHMRLVWRNEIAQLVAEDNSDARAAIKGSFDLLRNPSDNLRKSDLVPLKRIRGPVLFAEKAESRPLQLADTCAFFVRRRLVKNDEKSRRFYSKLMPWMLQLPNGDEYPELKTMYPFGPLLIDKSEAK